MYIKCTIAYYYIFKLWSCMIVSNNNVYCLFQLSLRLLDRGLNYRTQLLHSYFKKQKSESSTHLKINYNNQIPLVAGVHWKDVSKSSLHKWEGVYILYIFPWWSQKNQSLICEVEDCRDTQYHILSANISDFYDVGYLWII